MSFCSHSESSSLAASGVCSAVELPKPPTAALLLPPLAMLLKPGEFATCTGEFAMRAGEFATCTGEFATSAGEFATRMRGVSVIPTPAVLGEVRGSSWWRGGVHEALPVLLRGSLRTPKRSDGGGGERKSPDVSPNTVPSAPSSGCTLAPRLARRRALMR